VATCESEEFFLAGEAVSRDAAAAKGEEREGGAEQDPLREMIGGAGGPLCSERGLSLEPSTRAESNTS
jgi:hypothetical protein